MTEDEIQALLLYRDGLILVLNKPVNMPVHRGPKGGDFFEAHFDHLRFGLPRAPALAHRLDKDTSGCLVLGRHRKALEKLMQLFKRGEIDKSYWAIVEGGPEADTGLIDLALAPRDPDRGWWMKVDAAGAPSQTKWRVLGRANSLTWLELEPLTGRTHQLRVHCQAMGWPIYGDPIYGTAQAEPLHLHARSIKIPLSRNKPPVEVVAPPPAHMLARLAKCGADLANLDQSQPILNAPTI